MCSGGGGGGSTKVETPAQPAAAASAVRAANVEKESRVVLGGDDFDAVRRRAMGRRNQRVQLGTSVSDGSSGLSV